MRPLPILTLLTLLPPSTTAFPLPSPPTSPCTPPPTTFSITDFTVFTGPLISLVQFGYSSSSSSSSTSDDDGGGGAARQTTCTHFSLTTLALATTLAPDMAGGGVSGAPPPMQPCADAGVAYAWDAGTGTVAVAETGACGCVSPPFPHLPLPTSPSTTDRDGQV